MNCTVVPRYHVTLGYMAVLAGFYLASSTSSIQENRRAFNMLRDDNRAGALRGGGRGSRMAGQTAHEQDLVIGYDGVTEIGKTFFKPCDINPPLDIPGMQCLYVPLDGNVRLNALRKVVCFTCIALIIPSGSHRCCDSTGVPHSQLLGVWDQYISRQGRFPGLNIISIITPPWFLSWPSLIVCMNLVG